MSNATGEIINSSSCALDPARSSSPGNSCDPKPPSVPRRHRRDLAGSFRSWPSVLPRPTIVWVSIVSGTEAGEAEPVHFSRDILPILSENCFPCHGPDAKARKADLRLDIKEASALRAAEPVIVPGKSGESELFQRHERPRVARRADAAARNRARS